MKCRLRFHFHKLYYQYLGVQKIYESSFNAIFDLPDIDLDNRISILVLNLNYFMRVHRQHVQRKPSRLLKLFNLHQNRFE